MALKQGVQLWEHSGISGFGNSELPWQPGLGLHSNSCCSWSSSSKTVMNSLSSVAVILIAIAIAARLGWVRRSSLWSWLQWLAPTEPAASAEQVRNRIGLAG